MEKRSERIARQKKERWENLHLRKFDLVLPFLIVIGILGYHQIDSYAQHYGLRQVQQVATIKKAKLTKKAAEKNAHSSVKSVMRTPINWRESSETVPYPDLSKVKDFWVKVSLKKNRTYLMSGNKVIYTMYSSGGLYHKDHKTGKMVSDTPTGTFWIQNDRGDSFYNSILKEGANYWVSWKDNGVYLFHTVPTNANGTYNVKEADKLGKEPASHGCIRLSIPDAKWMMQNLKVGTKVVIEN